MVQGKLWYRVAGTVTRTQFGIAEMGISLYTSWPSAVLLTPLAIPNN